MFFRNELYTPCGAGHEEKAKLQAVEDTIFQSTRPVWGGTLRHHDDLAGGGISIHPPRAGRDSNKSQNCFCNLLHNIQ